MGKGKRNRQFHFEDKQSNPEKYKEPKKPFRMPKWATYTIWSALLVIVVAAIVLTSLSNNGVFLRSRILLNSQKDDQFNLNQQMATFIVWQNMYQSAYTEFLYTQYGLYEDTYNIVKTYGSADAYGLMMGQYYVSTLLRDGVDSSKDYFEELVAGADKAKDLGLTLNKNDEASIEEVVDFMKSLHKKYASDVPFDNFLGYYVGQGISEKDVRQAATLMAMYTKYCDYSKFVTDVNSVLDKNDKNNLLDFIANNPSGHYEALYRVYQVSDKAIAEALEKAKDVKEFTAMVVDRVMDLKFESTAFEKFTMPRAKADEKLIIEALKNKGAENDTKDDLAAAEAKAGELGLISTLYTKTTTKVTKDGKETIETTYSPELKDVVSKWLFNSSRKAGDVTVLSDGTTAYLVYFYTQSTITNDSTSVKAGIKEYKVSEDSDKYASFKETLIKDMNTDDRKNSTDNKAAEDFAKVLYDELKKAKDDKKTVALPTDNKKTETIKKPAENATKTALQEYLFAEGKKVAAGDLYQVDDDGTSYVVIVDSVNDKKDAYTVSYATFEDSDYYHFYRTVKAQMDSTYPATAPKLTHPESAAEKSFEEWLCEADVVKATADKITERNFKRKANEIKTFEVKDSKGEKVTGYKVYIVVEPMKLIQDEEASVYGGYLKFDKEADANAALETIKGLKDFDLWHSFRALTSTTVSGTGETAKETVNEATLKTDMTKTDIPADEMDKWFFDAARKMNDVAVIKSSDGKAFYLVYYKSNEQLWTRNARDEWIADKMEDDLDALIKNGGYALNQDVLNKIGKPSETTTTAAHDHDHDH